MSIVSRLDVLVGKLFLCTSRLSRLKQPAAVLSFCSSSSLFFRALPVSTAVVIGYVYDIVLGAARDSGLGTGVGAGDGFLSSAGGVSLGVVDFS